MSNVTLEIGGRSFTVACAAGEEAHVASLGEMIAGKIAEMDGMASQSEARMLLFASLLLADELHEARANAASVGAPPAPDRSDLLEGIADRLENMATRLEAQLRTA